MRNLVPRGRPRSIAFYLPQFHQIPENDLWWGDGFTEWRNVIRAEPVFASHDQPRVPTDLGYYDLSSTEVMHHQAALALRHDVDAFCFYFYWFGGKRLLDRPLDDFLASGPDMPFCLSWANESWTRRWDGKEHEVLIAQDYGPGFVEGAFDALVPYLRDTRYVRVAGAAVILVHRSERLPDARALARTWRERADRAGVGPLHLVATETVHGVRPGALGFDAVAEFPPVGANTLSNAWLRPLGGLNSRFRGRLLSYDRVAARFSRRADAVHVRYPGVMPGWDNTPRRGKAATIYVGSSPLRYASWLAAARARELRVRGGDGLVFINAWNEWAEGAYLEPDVTSGRDYLEATWWDSGLDLSAAQASLRGRPSLPWVMSLARLAASGALSVIRQVRRLVSRLVGRAVR